MIEDLENYRKKIELKRGQLSIVKHAVEVYLATVTETYDKHPSSKNLERVLAVQSVLDLFKNGRQNGKIQDPKRTQETPR